MRIAAAMIALPECAKLDELDNEQNDTQRIRA